jgi:hypothetical protein
MTRVEKIEQSVKELAGMNWPSSVNGLQNMTQQNGMNKSLRMWRRVVWTS